MTIWLFLYGYIIMIAKHTAWRLLEAVGEISHYGKTVQLSLILQMLKCLK